MHPTFPSRTRGLVPRAGLLCCLLALGGAASADTDDQWLEAPHDAAALRWARDATADTRARLGALPRHAVLAAELDAALAASPAEPDVVLLGDRALRFQRDAAHPHGLLQVAARDAAGKPGSWRTVLDVAALRASEGVAFELQAYDLSDACAAPAYTRCLLRLSPAGGDEVEIREFDLAQAAFVDGGFHVARSRAFAQWIDPDLVLVEHTIGDAPKTAAGWPASVRLWSRGQALDAARVVYTARPDDAIVQLSTVGSGEDRRGVITRAIDYSTFEIHLVDRTGGVHKADLPRALKPMGVLTSGDRHLIVQLADAATLEGVAYPAETLLAYAATPDADGRHVSAVYVPRDGEFIGGRNDVAASGNRVAFVINEHLRQRVQVATPDDAGWSVRELLRPDDGQVVGVRAAADGDLVLVFTGFTTPRRQVLHTARETTTVLAEDPSVFDADSYTTTIGQATSADGTVIDYYLLQPRQSPWAGAQPTLMTGYGAFGTSVRPGYFDYTVGGRAFRLWLARGGSLVIPAIRGGGERGNAWHHAAIREKRQNSYDDFIAVASHLVDTGYTTPAHIGIYGTSNGGLLTATLGTQRPDLFGAVVSDVPLADMLRMKYMGMGAAWLNEYGDPDNPAHREVLLRYSPVHNIHAGTRYPPFLVTISTEDNRVGPGHARKLASRLQAAGAPVHFYEDEEGGHGVSDPLRNPELMALRMTFLIDTLMPSD